MSSLGDCYRIQPSKLYENRSLKSDMLKKELVLRLQAKKYRTMVLKYKIPECDVSDILQNAALSILTGKINEDINECDIETYLFRKINIFIMRYWKQRAEDGAANISTTVFNEGVREGSIKEIPDEDKPYRKFEDISCLIDDLKILKRSRVKYGADAINVAYIILRLGSVGNMRIADELSELANVLNYDMDRFKEAIDSNSKLKDSFMNLINNQESIEILSPEVLGMDRINSYIEIRLSNYR